MTAVILSCTKPLHSLMESQSNGRIASARRWKASLSAKVRRERRSDLPDLLHLRLSEHEAQIRRTRYAPRQRQPPKLQPEQGLWASRLVRTIVRVVVAPLRRQHADERVRILLPWLFAASPGVRKPLL